MDKVGLISMVQIPMYVHDMADPWVSGHTPLKEQNNQMYQNEETDIELAHNSAMLKLCA